MQQQQQEWRKKGRYRSVGERASERVSELSELRERGVVGEWHSFALARGDVTSPPPRHDNQRRRRRRRRTASKRCCCCCCCLSYASNMASCAVSVASAWAIAVQLSVASARASSDCAWSWTRVAHDAQATKWRDSIARWLGFRTGLRRQNLLHRPQQQENDVDRPARQVALHSKLSNQPTNEPTN